MKILFSIAAFLFLMDGNIFSQDTAAKNFRIDSLPANGILLDKGWKFHEGDNPEWAKPDVDDSKWQSITISDFSTYLPQFKTKDIAWFRLNLLIDSSLLKNQLAFQLTQLGASEIYLNGHLFQQVGSINLPSEIKSFNPVGKPFLLPLNTGRSIVIAIRFATHTPSRIWLFNITRKSPLLVTVNSWKNGLNNYETILNRARIPTGISYMYMALALLFILLFVFFPKEKVNLLFGVFCSLQAINLFLEFQLSQGNLDIREFGLISFLMDATGKATGAIILSIISQAVLHRITFYHWILFCSLAIDSLLFWSFGPIYPQLVLNFLLHIFFTLAFLQLSIYAFRQRSYIIGIVATNSFVLNIYFFFVLFANLDPNYLNYCFALNFVVITLYVSINFARKSKNLEVQVVEIENLSEENLKKEQEKQQMLASQNEKLEYQVKERTIALTHSIEELTATQSQLIQSEKMASLGELTAGIAHEIQNPLNFVNNFSEVNRELIQEMKNELKAGNKEEAVSIADDIDENEKKISHHGKRADAIVKGMLQHSRSNPGQKEPTDINALADEYLRLAYHGLRAKDNSFNATMKTDFDETIQKIDIIPQDIGRVLLNLYTNAFYAANEKKKQQGAHYDPIVSVSTKRLDNKVEVKVEDNGSGIPQKVMDKIFQPFFTTKSPGQGTGLGLSLSYDIIKAHGGEIKVHTTEGECAAFVIQLPVTV